MSVHRDGWSSARHSHADDELLHDVCDVLLSSVVHLLPDSDVGCRTSERRSDSSVLGMDRQRSFVARGSFANAESRALLTEGA